MRAVPCHDERRGGAGCGGTLWQAALPDCGEALLSAYAGKVQLLYIDPPFFTGQQFAVRMRVGKRVISLPAYDDAWESEQAYVSLMGEVLRIAHALLRNDGTLFLHVDARMQAPLRLLLDDIFGGKNFLNEIIWAYQTGGRAKRHFSRKHDVILFYRKSARYFFDITAVPVPRAENRSNHMRRGVDERGRAYRAIKSGGKEYRYYDDDPVYPGDVWQDVSHLQQKDPQRTGYDTQKPLALLERIVQCASRPGDLVADLCFGSGTSLVAAAQLGRRFLGVDCGQAAHAVARKRLLDFAAEHTTTSSMPAVQVETELFSAIGFYDVQLTACVPDDALNALGLDWAAYRGLDAVDQWSVGFLRGEQFVSLAHAARAVGQGKLPLKLEMPMLDGKPAVCIVDVLGRKQVYTWEEQHA